MSIKFDKYMPLYAYLSPASIPQIVAHIQDYLVKHPILSVETIAEIIVQSLQEHPELINGEAIPISADSQQSIKAYIDALPFLDTYTKAEINALLLGKQDTLTFDQAPTPGSSNPVTSSGIIAAMSALQSALETQISAKADRASTYTKTQVDTLLEDKADADDVYSKNTMDAKLLDVNTDIGNLEDKLIDQSQQIETVSIAAEPPAEARPSDVDGVKAYLSGIAATMKANEIRPVTFTTNFSNDVFTQGVRAYGILISRNTNGFTFIGADLNGITISISCYFNTWTIYKVAKYNPYLPIAYNPTGQVITSETGVADIIVPNGYFNNRRIMALSNYHDAIFTQYNVSVNGYDGTTVYIRVRNISDGVVVANTTIDASNIMLIGY